MRWIVLPVLLATGCYAESSFIPDKTDAFCSFLLECTDEAVLAFDGMDNETCLGVYGPVFEAEGETCRRFKRGLAKSCVESLLTAQCPPEGQSVVDHIPEVCDFVYERCDDLAPPAATEPPPEEAEQASRVAP